MPLGIELVLTASPERLAARPAHRSCHAEPGRILDADPYYYRTRGVEVAGVREWAPVAG
ncbi:hypothetical protein ACIOKD_12455 [Streptomyces sp. NPDC087844]|uniref:hypothetical protein n=1 Tax=Streptomyces sp. NPDC087844 TaxID=3365805 RepID=UPI0038096DCB